MVEGAESASWAEKQVLLDSIPCSHLYSLSVQIVPVQLVRVLFDRVETASL